MWTYLKNGLSLIRRLPWLFAMIVAYQIAWAAGLYNAFHSLLSPLIPRVPDGGFASLEFQILLAETQFRLYKTDAILPVATFLGGLFILRMMFTPFINAGLFYTIHADGDRSLWLFVRGCRQLGVRFLQIHAVQWALALAPPLIAAVIAGGWEAIVTGSIDLRNLTFFLFAYAGYSALLRLGILYVQFAETAQHRYRESVGLMLRRLLPIAGISFLLFLLYITAYSSLGLTSFVFAGFAGLVFYVLSYGIRVFFKMWEISAQYQFYRLATKNY